MHRRLSSLAIVLCLLATVVTPATAVAAKEEAFGERFVFELPFPSPPWNPEQLTWPATLLVVRAEMGALTTEGRKLKVIPRIANGSYTDVKVTVKISLLDADGNVVISESETDGLEEEEMSPFSFRLKVAEDKAQTITTCRIELIGEPK